MKTTLQLFFLFAALTSLGQSVGVRISTNTALTQGDQVIWSGSAWVTYGKGTNGQVLTMSGTNVVWANPTGGSGGGTGLVSSVSADFEVDAGELNITNTTGTGAILRTSSLSPYLLSATAASTYATLESPSFTGTVSFETIQADEVQVPFANLYASANSSSNLTGTLDGGSWTNLNGTEIRSGTVAAARIDSAIARLTSPSFIGTLTNTGSIGSPDLIAGSSLTLGSTTRTNLNSPDMEEFESVVVNFIRGNALTMTAIGWPTFTGAAISSGTITTTTDEAGHIGIANISSASGANSGLYLLSTSESFAQVGMTWESISKSINTNAGSMASYGFTDVATLGNPTDGIRLYRSNNFVLGQVFNNTVLTQTAQAPILSNQWISVKIQITDTNSVAFDVWDFNTSTSILSETLTALPGPSRTFGFGIIAGYTNAAATVIESVDKVRFSVY